MKRIAGRSMKFAGRAIVALVALLLVLAIAVQIGIWVAVGWLNTPPGQNWLVRQIASATASSGYKVEVRGLHMFGLRGLGIDQVSVADTAGPVADARRIRFYAEILPAVMTRHLSLSLAAGEVDVHRIPAGEKKVHEQSPGGLMQPFALPDLYVRGMTVRHFAIEKLTLDQGVAGPAMVLAPKLSALIGMRGNRLRFDVTAGSVMEGQPAFIPETIHAKGLFDSADAALTLDDLLVKAKGYAVTGKGAAGLAHEGTLALEIHADSDDLSVLSAGAAPGTLKSTWLLGGTGDHPALEMKGTVHLTDLAAKGLGDIELTAHADHLTGDAAGTVNVVTAYGQRAMTLVAAFAFADPVLTISGIKAAAPDIDAAGQLAYDTKSGLADGRIDAVFKLDGYKDLIGADIAGQGKASVAMTAEQASQTAALSAEVNHVRYQDMEVRTASLSASLADIKSPWPDTAKLVMSGARAGDITLTKMQAAVTKKDIGLYRLELNGNGQYQQSFTLSGSADLKGTDAATASADNIMLKLGAAKGALIVKGNVAPDRLALTMDAAKLPLAALPVALPAAMSGLTVSGNGAVDGMLNAPRAKVDLKFSPLTVNKDAPAVTLAMQGTYADGKAAGTARGTGKGIDILQGQGSAPMTLSLKPFAFAMPGSTPLAAALTAKMDAAALAGMMPPGESVKGRIDAQATVGGALTKPALAGAVSITKGEFVDEGANVALHDINMQAALAGDVVTLKSLHAGDGKGGTVNGSGTLNIGGTGAADVKLKTVNLNPFLSTGQIKGAFSADMALTGKTGAYALKGTITPDAIDITIPERFGSSVPQLNIVDTRKEKRKESEPLKTVTLDMKMHAPNRVFVRGWGLDAEFGGDLDVTGTLAAPLVNGTLASRRGRYEEFNKRFDLTRANLRFQGAVPPSPYLDIEAQTKADTITAVINLTGAATDPKIALSSVPALPQDEVLSRILFGKDMTKISPFQAIQLAGTLQRFTGHGSGRPGLLDTLRSKTGLDDLSVGNDDAGGTTVGAGKYITDKVYLQVGGGATKGSSAATVKYQVTPHVTIDSKVSQDAQAGGGVSWSWDY